MLRLCVTSLKGTFGQFFLRMSKNIAYETGASNLSSYAFVVYSLQYVHATFIYRLIKQCEHFYQHVIECFDCFVTAFGM